MLYRAILLSAAITAGFWAEQASAQDNSAAALRWDGFYVGGGLASHSAEARVKGSAVHNYEKDSGSLALYAGRLRVRPGGFAWGPELHLSSFSTPGRANDAALGASEFKGSFILSPRVRLGYATEHAFFYGILGLGLSDIAARPASDSGTNLALGGALGIGAEVATGDLWSVRAELTGYGFGSDDKAFNGSVRDTESEIGQFTLGITRKF